MYKIIYLSMHNSRFDLSLCSPIMNRCQETATELLNQHESMQRLRYKKKIMGVCINENSISLRCTPSKPRSLWYERTTLNHFLPPQLPCPAPDTLLLSSHLVWTINLLSFTHTGEEENQTETKVNREKKAENDFFFFLAPNFWRTVMV